jgi:hypothetical protein
LLLTAETAVKMNTRRMKRAKEVDAGAVGDVKKTRDRDPLSE